MEDKELIIKEQNGVIEALKVSNTQRQKIIDELMDGLLKKEKEIINLRSQIEEARFVIENLALK